MIKKIVDFFKSFNLVKALGKTLGGAIAAGIALVIQDPSSILTVIPEKWATMTVVGLIVEALDFLYYKLKPTA